MSEGVYRSAMMARVGTTSEEKDSQCFFPLFFVALVEAVGMAK